jgi:hypothetical protein
MFGKGNSPFKPQVVYVRHPRDGGCVTGCAMIVALLMGLFVLLMCGGMLAL